jgi:hypothetical protein
LEWRRDLYSENTTISRNIALVRSPINVPKPEIEA